MWSNLNGKTNDLIENKTIYDKTNMTYINQWEPLNAYISVFHESIVLIHVDMSLYFTVLISYDI